MNKTFITGSRAFFNGIEGFEAKDTDVVSIIYPAILTVRNLYRVIQVPGKDIFEIAYRPKQFIINHAVGLLSSMSLCMFLVPNIANEFGIDINDLPALKPLRERLGKKHEYIGYIYDSYVKNNNFVLTDEQLQEAYRIYKSARE